MHNIFGKNFKSCRIVNLLEITGKVPKVVIFPLDETTDLISELVVGNETARLVHGALIGSFEGRIAMVIPETAPLVAGLMLHLGADDVQDQRITRNLLIALHFDDVSCLDLPPVAHLETFRSLAKYELFNVFVVHFLSRGLQISIVQQI